MPSAGRRSAFDAAPRRIARRRARYRAGRRPGRPAPGRTSARRRPRDSASARAGWRCIWSCRLGTAQVGDLERHPAPRDIGQVAAEPLVSAPIALPLTATASAAWLVRSAVRTWRSRRPRLRPGDRGRHRPASQGCSTTYRRDRACRGRTAWPRAPRTRPSPEPKAWKTALGRRLQVTAEGTERVAARQQPGDAQRLPPHVGQHCPIIAGFESRVVRQAGASWIETVQQHGARQTRLSTIGAIRPIGRSLPFDRNPDRRSAIAGGQ